MTQVTITTESGETVSISIKDVLDTKTDNGLTRLMKDLRINHNPQQAEVQSGGG